jgi:hypothetical protein
LPAIAALTVFVFGTFGIVIAKNKVTNFNDLLLGSKLIYLSDWDFILKV